MGRPKSWTPMPVAKRAKIFAMFDAMKGLKEAIAAKEIIPEQRRYLAEDAIEELNCKLSNLQTGQLVTVVYFDNAQEKHLQMTGYVSKILIHEKALMISSHVIYFTDMLELSVE